MSNPIPCDSLVLGLLEVCRLQGISTSATQLTEGLPREQGAPLTVDLAPLALRRANMSCRTTREPLKSLPSHSFPVLVFLKDGRNIILEELLGRRAKVVLPESGGGKAVWTIEELERLQDGKVLISKPIDIVSDRLDGKKAGRGHWLLGPVWENWRVYRDVMIASMAANVLAVATVDRVIVITTNQ